MKMRGLQGMFAPVYQAQMVAMTAEHARELGEALLLAARAALMGDTPSYALN